MMASSTSFLLFLLGIAPLVVVVKAQTPVWSDEFGGTGLDTNVWGYDTGGGGWGNFELQTYTTQAVSVGNGHLKITADVDGNSGWTSGRINTMDNLMFMYGRLEARINVPDVADGLWPAFWTMGENFGAVGWPAAGELDIMEIGQGLAITEGVVNNRCIGGAHWEHQGTYATYADWETFDFYLNATWHNYTLDWTPTFVRTYVDNIQVFEMRIQEGPAAEGLCEDCEEFHQPHFILLNLAVGGLFTSVGGSGSSGSSGSSSSGGPCDASPLSGSSSSGCGSSGEGCGCFGPRTNATAPMPATMLVDYVRIFDNGFTMIHTPPSQTTPPTPQPSPQPTNTNPTPTPLPTSSPTVPQPSPQPTNTNPAPTPLPTSSPTVPQTTSPTQSSVPSLLPSKAPSLMPSRAPSRSVAPSLSASPTQSSVPTRSAAPTRSVAPSLSATPTLSPAPSLSAAPSPEDRVQPSDPDPPATVDVPTPTQIPRPTPRPTPEFQTTDCGSGSSKGKSKGNKGSKGSSCSGSSADTRAGDADEFNRESDALKYRTESASSSDAPTTTTTRMIGRSILPSLLVVAASTIFVLGTGLM